MPPVLVADLAEQGLDYAQTDPSRLTAEHIAAVSRDHELWMRRSLEARRDGRPDANDERLEGALIGMARATVIIRAIKRATALLVAAIREQREKIQALEAERERVKELRFVGIFAHDIAYKAGNFCTHGGSLWCCLKDTIRGDKPGGSPHWQLCAKHGRDLRAADVEDAR